MVAASAYFFTKQLESFAREADQALAPMMPMAVLACRYRPKAITSAGWPWRKRQMR